MLKTRKSPKKGTQAARTKGISLTERKLMQDCIAALDRRLTILETNNIYLNRRVAQLLHTDAE